MPKIDDLATIASSHASITKLNSNFNKIEEAFDNTLSRDGSTPNQMEADIDMNDNQLVNLADPTLDHNAATKQYVDDLIQATLSSVAGDATEYTTIADTAASIARRLGERAREYMSMLDFVMDEARREIILAGTFQSGANDTSAVQAALSWATADTTNRWLFVPGEFTCTADITGLHDAQLYGPGSIKVGTGARWYVSPSQLNTGFSPLGYNTLYVSASGSDSNSGLAPEFAVLTLDKACDKLVGHNEGFKKIQIAEGVYRGTANLFANEGSKAQKLVIMGPTPSSSWDNSTPPTAPVAITAITAANPPVVTAAGHGRSIGDKVMIYDAEKAASAEHESVGQIFTISSVSGNDITLSANGSTWSAYVGSGKLIDLTGSSPRAIFLGTKSTSTYAITQDTGDYVEYNDLMFVNWGTRATSQNAGGISVVNGYASLSNIHAYQCGQRVVGRDFTRVFTNDGGYVYNCGVGDWAVGGARFTYGGDSNPGTATLTTSTLYHKCIKAWDIWEDCSGHCDGAIIKDCDQVGEIFAGSHAVSYYNRYTNTTGSPLVGWVVNALGNLSRSNGATDVVSGTFTPIVDRRAGGTVVYSTDTGDKIRRTETLLYRDLPNSTTANGVDQTLMTYTIPAMHGAQAQTSFKVKSKFIVTNTLGVVELRVKVNGTNFYTHTIPAYANQQSGFMEVEYIPNSSGFARASVHIRVFETNGALQYERYSNYTPTFDTRTADLTLTLCMRIADAADTGQYTVAEVWADNM